MVRTFDVYQVSAKQTDQYPPETRLIALIAGLASEAGEVAGKLSKHLRGDNRYATDEQLREVLISELGDVLWYLAMVADALDVPLSEIASRNLDKLARRDESGTIKGDGDER